MIFNQKDHVMKSIVIRCPMLGKLFLRMLDKLFGKKKLSQKEFFEFLFVLFEDASEMFLKDFNIDKEMWFKCKPEMKFWLFTIAGNTFNKLMDKSNRDVALQFISDNIILSSVDIDPEHLKVWWQERSDFYHPDNIIKNPHFFQEFCVILFEKPMMTNAEISEIPIEFDARKDFERFGRGSPVFEHFGPGFAESMKMLVEVTPQMLK